jgi:sec-independent protein translocase protein TatA
MISMTHLVVVLVIVLIIFGPGKLPDLGEALGKGIKNFKKATDEKEIASAEKVEKVETGTAASESSTGEKNS